ncbi:hypothetical protein, partial [Kribbia dieselivorans]|uniref:hypothetical protein n=1 Tax=Kribbia dieselivorans TaxID=331526 RepID=UPI001C3F302C
MFTTAMHPGMTRPAPAGVASVVGVPGSVAAAGGGSGEAAWADVSVVHVGIASEASGRAWLSV